MKKIEITTLMNEQLNKEKLIFRDLLNQSIYIDSYEKFIQEFSMIKNIYKEIIPEFNEIAEECLNKMTLFINDCKVLEETEVKNLMSQKLYTIFYGNYYNRTANLSLVFPISLNNKLECSINAINQIYFELGYEQLLNYVELLKNPSYLGSWLSTQSKQDVAMRYILFKTDHHSNSKYKRNTSSNLLYQEMQNNINQSIEEITAKKDDYIGFVNEEKEQIHSWYESSQQKYDEFMKSSDERYEKFMTSCNEKITNLEKTYSEKLKVEKPAEFMLNKSKEYESKTKFWVALDVLVATILLCLLAIIINPKIEWTKKVISIKLFSSEMPIYSSIIILAMICLIIYVLRIMIKITMSSKHLCEEYKQKYILSYFYLSLINEGKMEEKIGQTILTLLFSKADTGLIKNDNGSEYESIIKMLTSSGK